MLKSPIIKIYKIKQCFEIQKHRGSNITSLLISSGNIKFRNTTLFENITYTPTKSGNTALMLMHKIMKTVIKNNV